LLLVADVRRTVRAGEKKLREPGRLLRQGRDIDAELAADFACDESAASMPIVEAVAAAKLVDDRVRPHARPAVGPGDGLRFAIQPAKVDQSGATVAASRLERERVRIPPLPTHAREQRVAAGELMVDADVGAITLPLERHNLPERAITV